MSRWTSSISTRRSIAARITTSSAPRRTARAPHRRSRPSRTRGSGTSTPSAPIRKWSKAADGCRKPICHLAIQYVPRMLYARLSVLDQLTEKHFETKFLSHAAAILEKDFPQALTELDEALSGLTIPITEIVAVGGGET